MMSLTQALRYPFQCKGWLRRILLLTLLQLLPVVGQLILLGYGFDIARAVYTQQTTLPPIRWLPALGNGLRFLLAALVYLLPILIVATQNSLLQSRMGVGTGAITFLRSIGSTLATAVLGTIVNIVSAEQISAHLPAAVHHFSHAYLKAATDKQVLTGATYRHTIIQQGITNSVRAAHVAPGPQHDATIATITQQTTTLLNQVFEVVRQALASSIHQTFVIVFYLCLVIILTTIFLKDSSALPTGKPGKPRNA